MQRLTMASPHWRILFTLSVLATLLVGLSAAALPPKAAAPSQPVGSVGPIDPRTLISDVTHTRAVPDGGYTFYTDTHGETATGAVPDDALMGFSPAATGESISPKHELIPCEQPTPQGLRDHATFTDAELDRFGLPHLDQVGHGDLAEWQNIVRTANTRSCSWTDHYHDGHVDSAANLGRGSIGVKATMPGHTTAPRHTTTPGWQSNFRWQGETGSYSWGAWADDAVNFSFNGYYYAAEGYVHALDPLGNPNNLFDVRPASVAAWLGIGGFQNNQCQGAHALVQDGEESNWSGLGGYDFFLLIDNTGSSQNCHVRDVVDFVNPGDEIYMQTGCGYATGPCTHVFVQDQNMTRSPNYYGGYMDGQTPNTQSAECSVENPISGWILPWFGTASFQLCRVSTSENGTDYGESGFGNVPNGHYSVFEEQDPNTFYNCYTVNNFTDANNWTFYVVRDDSVNTQNC